MWCDQCVEKTEKYHREDSITGMFFISKLKLIIFGGHKKCQGGATFLILYHKKEKK